MDDCSAVNEDGLNLMENKMQTLENSRIVLLLPN